MSRWKTTIALAAAFFLGGIASQLVFDQRSYALSGDSRYQDFIMSTGRVLLPNQRKRTDGVWLLDYRTGKLLGTVIDRNLGKIIGWAEVDLLQEFRLTPRQDVHFMMTTGTITDGQSALYLAEVSTGQLGVYTMGAQPNGRGVANRQHDLVYFRQPKQAKQP